MSAERPSSAVETLSVTLKFPDVTTFVNRFATFLERGRILLPGVAARPPGSAIRFQLKLKDGTNLIAGQGVVETMVTAGAIVGCPPGMVLQYEPDPASRSLCDRILGSRGSAPSPMLPAAIAIARPAAVPPPVPSAAAPTPAAAPPLPPTATLPGGYAAAGSRPLPVRPALPLSPLPARPTPPLGTRLLSSSLRQNDPNSPVLGTRTPLAIRPPLGALGTPSLKPKLGGLPPLGGRRIEPLKPAAPPVEPPAVPAVEPAAVDAAPIAVAPSIVPSSDDGPVAEPARHGADAGPQRTPALENVPGAETAPPAAASAAPREAEATGNLPSIPSASPVDEPPVVTQPVEPSAAAVDAAASGEPGEPSVQRSASEPQQIEFTSADAIDPATAPSTAASAPAPSTAASAPAPTPPAGERSAPSISPEHASPPPPPSLGRLHQPPPINKPAGARSPSSLFGGRLAGRLTEDKAAAGEAVDAGGEASAPEPGAPRHPTLPPAPRLFGSRPPLGALGSKRPEGLLGRPLSPPVGSRLPPIGRSAPARAVPPRPPETPPPSEEPIVEVRSLSELAVEVPPRPALATPVAAAIESAPPVAGADLSRSGRQAGLEPVGPIELTASALLSSASIGEGSDRAEVTAVEGAEQPSLFATALMASGVPAVSEREGGGLWSEPEDQTVKPALVLRPESRPTPTPGSGVVSVPLLPSLDDESPFAGVVPTAVTRMPPLPVRSPLPSFDEAPAAMALPTREPAVSPSMVPSVIGPRAPLTASDPAGASPTVPMVNPVAVPTPPITPIQVRHPVRRERGLGPSVGRKALVTIAVFAIAAAAGIILGAVLP